VGTMESKLVGYYEKHKDVGPGWSKKFLADEIYPKLVDDSVQHDQYYCMKYKGSTSFPLKRLGYEKAGKKYNPQDELYLDPNEAKEKEGNPTECKRNKAWQQG